MSQFTSGALSISTEWPTTTASGARERAAGRTPSVPTTRVPACQQWFPAVGTCNASSSAAPTPAPTPRSCSKELTATTSEAKKVDRRSQILSLHYRGIKSIIISRSDCRGSSSVAPFTPLSPWIRGSISWLNKITWWCPE